jgi:hypothetical protein
MTGKVPVERAIADGYGFAFRNFLSLLGIIWLPYLVFLLVSFALVWLIAPDLPRMIVMQDFDLPAVMKLGRLALLIGVLGFITGCMVTVGVQRRAQGLHPRAVWFWFSLGAPVWRMAGAFFLAAIVIFLIALLTAGVGTAIWFGANRLGGAAWFIHVLDVCAGAAFLIYVMVGLLFFLPAIVVAEGLIGLERSWILGGHNFWRILIVSLAIMLPVTIAFHILSWAIFGPFASLRMGAGLSAREMLRAVILNFGAIGPFAILFQILERIVLIGVTNGAVASAYFAVSGGRPEAAPGPGAAPAA